MLVEHVLLLLFIVFVCDCDEPISVWYREQLRLMSSVDVVH